MLSAWKQFSKPRSDLQLDQIMLIEMRRTRIILLSEVISAILCDTGVALCTTNTLSELREVVAVLALHEIFW